MFIHQMILKNFRCFRKEQNIRLAPLTLLMGENSTGKTSLMAMLRILMDTVHGNHPDFKEAPYDLGAFDEIVYHDNSKKRPQSFEAGFALKNKSTNLNMNIIFGKKESKSIHPSSVKERIALEDKKIWMEWDFKEKHLQFGTKKDSWIGQANEKNHTKSQNKRSQRSIQKDFWTLILEQGLFSKLPLEILIHVVKWTSKSNFKKAFSENDLKPLQQLLQSTHKLLRQQRRPYASAPVRSKPQRTYDPTRAKPDPEGEGIIHYIADLSWQYPEKWAELKEQLEKFGKQAGMFNEISIKRLGKTGGSPFQVEIRKFGRTKGSKRNLIDVGYGVSQVLPVIAELLLPDTPSLFLLQQPEVHLHPSAQAALGSFFCQMAEKKTQLLVETHSDYLMDRICMDIRDKKTKLKPEDLSILFFERKDQAVNIHSIEIDQEGNILKEPPGYRQFFMNETDRALGLKS